MFQQIIFKLFSTVAYKLLLFRRSFSEKNVTGISVNIPKMFLVTIIYF